MNAYERVQDKGRQTVSCIECPR